MRWWLLASALLTPVSAMAADSEIVGTWRLISEERRIQETGEIIPVANAQGFITYGADNRMMVIIVRGDRPKPESVEKMTDQQRAELFRTMSAYGGSYTFDGTTVTHNIDISWNGTWTGTKQVRTVARDGARIVLITPPFQFSGDGRVSVQTLTWEKIR